MIISWLCALFWLYQCEWFYLNLDSLDLIHMVHKPYRGIWLNNMDVWFVLYILPHVSRSLTLYWHFYERLSDCWSVLLMNKFIKVVNETGSSLRHLRVNILVQLWCLTIKKGNHLKPYTMISLLMFLNNYNISHYFHTMTLCWIVERKQRSIYSNVLSVYQKYSCSQVVGIRLGFLCIGCMEFIHILWKLFFIIILIKWITFLSTIIK